MLSRRLEVPLDILLVEMALTTCNITPTLTWSKRPAGVMKFPIKDSYKTSDQPHPGNSNRHHHNSNSAIERIAVALVNLKVDGTVVQ